MKTLRIVLLDNEKYAVQLQRYWRGGWEFCESNHKECEPNYSQTWGSLPEHVLKYCMINTEKEAEMVLEKTIKAHDTKKLKVVRVIKKVRI
jgi:hypothetical protein